METRELQSKVSSNREIAEENIISKNDIRITLGRDCEVTNVMKFLKEIEMLEKIRTTQIGDEISITRALPYSYE